MTATSSSSHDHRPSDAPGPQLDVAAKSHLHESVARANGMMPAAIYEAVWSVSAQTGGGVYLELGTAHGAGTIALALGARAVEKPVVIHSIDRLGGRFSSRAQFGSPSENEAIVCDNFGAAGVGDCIQLFVGSSDEFVAQGHCPPQIDLLMLDADGRIDRDLGYFYSLLRPGAPIIIDDADDGVYLGTLHDGTRYVDLKHRLTSLLVAAFQEAGYLHVERVLHATAFCRRGDRDLDHDELRRLALACYRELVISPVAGCEWDRLFAFRDGTLTEGRKSKPHFLARISRQLRKVVNS